MSPPQLTADTPVLDVLHPVTVCILELRRIELQVVIHNRSQSDLCQVFHLQEPLHRQFRFDRHIGTFRVTYLIFISFYLFQQAGSFQVFFDLCTNIETIHADIQAGSLAQCSIIVEDIDGRQVIFLAQHIVVYVMGRSYFQATCTEFDIYIIVLDNRDHTVYQRNNHLLTFQVLIFRVVRIDTHSGIAHDRFRTGSCNNGVTVFPFDFITEVKQFAMFFFINYFFIGKSSQGLRVPVYHTHTAIDQAFVE